jgi:hypothetical protein
MSDFAWTLIDIRALRTLFINTICFIKKMCAYWDGINVVFCKESLDGMDGISTELLFGVLMPVWQGKGGRYPSCRV